MLRRFFYLIYTLGGLKVEGIIFGAGNLGKGLKRGLEKHYDIHICAICDNDKNKWGGILDNILIIPPHELLKISFEKIFICVSKEFGFRKIKEQLLNMGISNEKITVMPISNEY